MISFVLLKSLSLMAWRNLRRNFKRNFATGVAITAGFIAFLMAAGYANRVDNVLSRYTIYGLRTGHITILHKDALDMYPIRPKQWSLTPDVQQKISAVLSSSPEIEIYGRILTGQGIVGNGCKTFPFIATGVEMHAERYAMAHPDLLKWAPHISTARTGKPLWEYGPETVPVALSHGLAKVLGKTKVLADFGTESLSMNVIDCKDENAQEHFDDDANVQLASGTWDGQLNAMDADVVQNYNTGIVETNNSSLTIGLDHLQSLFNTSNIRSYSVWLKDRNQLDTVMKGLTQKLSDVGQPIEILPWNNDKIGPYYVGSMRFIGTMVTFIGFVLALVVVLSIFNSATMTVIERSEEIGMLRSLGYTQRLIRLIFALEGLFLTFISIIFGIIGGIIATFVINRLDIKFTPPGVEGGMQLLIVINFTMIVLATLGSCVLGVIATWLAVSGISRKNISQLVAGTYR